MTVPAILLALVLALSFGCQEAATPQAPPLVPSLRGTLHVVGHGEGGGGESPVLRHGWVRGPTYGAVEDNDLRGFLDGRFIYGWNQPGQIHSRLGRRPTRSKFGETELYRTLQRWDAISLPADVTVHEARLRIGVEDGPGRALDVLAYAVLKDWDPGQGGTERNNTSPPRPGEVWWGEAAHGSRPWGLPGVGFASESHPEADTPKRALAEAHWEPEQAEFVLEGPGLAAYAQGQLRAREPLRLLLKVSDDLEDRLHTVLRIYTANHGDLRNPARRPLLELTWSAPGVRLQRSERVHLEAGRSLQWPRFDLRGARHLSVAFEPDAPPRDPSAGPLPLTVQVRGGQGEVEPSAWRAAEHPMQVDWEWAELRVLAATQPVQLGDHFETSLRDTWVRTKPPEQQIVTFELVAPRGERFLVPAEFRGDYTWTLSFQPDELGRWRYRFRQDFLKKPYESSEGFFDVVLLERERALEQLAALADRLRATSARSGASRDRELSPLATVFWRLERAALALETPESFASPGGRELFDRLTEVRELLSGRKVPDESTLKRLEREF